MGPELKSKQREWFAGSLAQPTSAPSPKPKVTRAAGPPPLAATHRPTPAREVLLFVRLGVGIFGQDTCTVARQAGGAFCPHFKDKQTDA